ncbi:MAG: rhodanese-like domain-containing protein [Pelagibaca sp.]
MRDFGVPPQQQLRQDQFHAHTPTSIPGAQLVTTESLLQGMNSGMQMVVIDVLGSGYGLPNTYVAPALSAPGSFNDRTQQQGSQWLNQITGTNKNMPIVIYCSDPMCWLSYNASLRAVAAGFTNVYWYRGGIQAWEMAGLPLRPTGF